MWAIVIDLAQEAGIPPWQFEAECSRYWLEALVAYRQQQRIALQPHSLALADEVEDAKPKLAAQAWNTRGNRATN